MSRKGDKHKHPRSKTPPEQRFWKFVNKAPGYGPKGTCWVWMGAVAGEYGRFWNGTRIVQAHHFAYETKHGKMPEGAWLDHKECEFKLCVNPDHTILSNVQENTRRFFENMTHCFRGHEYTPENTRVWRGTRACKTCIYLNGRARALKTKTKELFG